MKKYIVYDENLDKVLYRSNDKSACEDFCVNQLEELEDMDPLDLNERFHVCKVIQSLGCSWKDEE